MTKKQLSYLVISLVLIFLIDCSSVTIKDEIVFGNKGSLGAVQLHTLTSDQQDLTKPQWDKILLTQPLICASTSTFGDIKIAIEQLCSVCNCCSYNTQAAITDFFNNVNSVEVKK